MANVLPFPDSDGLNLNEGERQTLINLYIGHRGRCELVLEDFRFLYPKKDGISAKTVKFISEYYKSEIKQKIKDLAESGKLNPFACKSFVLTEYWTLYVKAGTKHYLTTKKVGKDDYQDVEGPDIALQKSILDQIKKFHEFESDLEFRKRAHDMQDDEETEEPQDDELPAEADDGGLAKW